jgi:hypothetical protein
MEISGTDYFSRSGFNLQIAMAEPARDNRFGGHVAEFGETLGRGSFFLTGPRS